MPYRELLSEILFEAQATGKGAVSRNDLDGHFPLIDPRLRGDTPIVSLVSNIKPRTSYNKSKKRVKVEISNDEEGIPISKKVDLRQAIAGITAKMARGRKAQEEAKSVQEKAVQLLESVYGDRLNTIVFIKACTFFEEENKARSFLAITNTERRSRWLEINLRIELITVR
jgi:hypothetical protein